MKFSIGCDHAGPAYKKAITEHLESKGYEVVNRGTDTDDSVDYPDYAHKVASDVESGSVDFGILICGSANGVSMTANKYAGVRAGLAWTAEIAELAKSHNDANIISIPARFVSQEVAVSIVDAFVNTEFEGGRHQRRVSKIACAMIAFFMAPFGIFAQTDKEVKVASDQMQVEDYSAMIDSAGLYDHLRILASDKFEGRETGTRGCERTADFLVDQYKKMGFEPYNSHNYKQKVPLVNSQLQDGVISVGDDSYKLLEDFLVYPGISALDLKSEMVFAGYGVTNETRDDYAKIDANGKVVVVLSGDIEESEWAQNTNKKRDLAVENGASAFVVLMESSEYKTFKGRMKFYMQRKSTSLDAEREGEGSDVPTFIMDDSTVDSWFDGAKKYKSASDVRKASKKKGKSVSFDLDVAWNHNIKKEVERFISHNILAYLPGSDPLLKKEVLVVTSHYDHIGIVDGEINNGADDDGSGTVAVLEIAQSFMEAYKNGNGPRRSILFMNVVGEEKGLLGSEWYSENPVFPLEYTVANLNIDMIGRVDEDHEGNDNYIYLIGSDKLSSQLHRISEKSNMRYVGLELDYMFNAPDDPNRFYYRSDHYNFAKHNIPVIFYFSGVHEDYHAPGDDYEKIMYNKTAKVARLVFHTAWELVNRDKKIVVDVENDFKD
jgi:RpiB/LacA/LacB family sugar-phosphate isomerase